MMLQRTGKVSATSDSHLIGIMAPAAFTFPCQIIFPTPSNVSNARIPTNGKALPTNTQSPIMALNNNSQIRIKGTVVRKGKYIKIKQVLGTFLYYARAVDLIMLVALSAISSEQASPIKSTMEKVDQFLDYAKSKEQAILTYESSNMVLASHSNASYLR